MLHRLAGLALAVLALLVPASVAAAAPVTVNLRVEGSAGTLYEGAVTTDARPALATASSGGAHPCDVGENSATPAATRAPTPTTALADSGVSWDATWSPTFFDFFVSRVGTDVNQPAAPFASWGVAVNFTGLQVGGCQAALSQGQEVLWAYDFFNQQHLLKLTGPTTASVGAAITVNVVDGQNGAPVAGATVGGATTDAAGNARVTLGTPGLQRLKAEAPASVRSNALVVAVGAAAQGVAGVRATADRTAPRARLLSPRNNHTYRRTKFSPRLIHIAVAESGSGVRTVKLRLTRRLGNRCFSYSGKRERFLGAKCGTGFFFTVSSKSDFTYLLPEKLPRGHYVLDVGAIDNAFNRDAVGVRGRNRSVFDVR
jgi:hypothetical protein